MTDEVCRHLGSNVVETRRREDGSLYRRRNCWHCQSRFSTVEVDFDEYEKLQGESQTLHALIPDGAAADESLMKMRGSLFEMVGLLDRMVMNARRRSL